jgi:hypothetical protein
VITIVVSVVVGFREVWIWVAVDGFSMIGFVAVVSVVIVTVVGVFQVLVVVRHVGRVDWVMGCHVR